MANSGASLPQMQRMFRWRSESMAKVYVDTSEVARNQDSRMIQGLTSTSVSTSTAFRGEEMNRNVDGDSFLNNTVFTNCTICVGVPDERMRGKKRKWEDDSSDDDFQTPVQ